MSTFLFTNNSAAGGGSSPSLVITVQPQGVSGSRTGVGGIQSLPAFLTVSGGVQPYTYVWEHVAGSTFTVLSPAEPTTRFYTYADAIPALFQGFYRCTVTDSATVPNTVTSNTITVDLYATSTSGL